MTLIFYPIAFQNTVRPIVSVLMLLFISMYSLLYLYIWEYKA